MMAPFGIRISYLGAEGRRNILRSKLGCVCLPQRRAEGDVLRIFDECESRAEGRGDGFSRRIENALALLSRMPRLGRFVGEPLPSDETQSISVFGDLHRRGKRVAIQTVVSNYETLEVILGHLPVADLSSRWRHDQAVLRELPRVTNNPECSKVRSCKTRIARGLFIGEKQTGLVELPTSHDLSEKSCSLMRTHPFLLILLVLAGVATVLRAAEEEVLTETVKFHRPDWECSIPGRLEALFKKAGIRKGRRISVTFCNPFYLQGDFDGDGKLDFLCYLEDIPTPKADSAPDVEKEKSSEITMVAFFGDGNSGSRVRRRISPKVDGLWLSAGKGFRALRMRKRHCRNGKAMRSG